MINNDNIRAKIDLLKSGELSVEQNVKDFLAEIKKKNEKYNIVLEINKNALNIAKDLDVMRKNNDNLGSLFGLCFLIKSNISYKDMFISCASKTLKNYKGSFNADCVNNIIKEGGIIIGILNNDEFANGASGETSAFNPTNNPFSIGRIPGGSSSGSAAAIAANFCDIALGSDTGGSIRNPASHCGVIGIKPSFGRVSRYGLVDLSMSLDQIGPLSKDVYGSALTLSVIAGHSENDATTTYNEVQNYSEINPSNKLKIGVIKDFTDMIGDKEIKDVFEKNINELKSKGHEIVNIEIENIGVAIQAYYPIVYTEFFSGTRKFDSVKYGEKIEETAGEEVLRRIFGGSVITQSEYDGAYYKKALKIKELIAKEFEKAFQKVDCILSPVTPKLPHKLGSEVSVDDMYAYDAFTTPANLAGICSGVISKDTIKVGNETLSVGIQVMADKFCEDKMFLGLKTLEGL